MPPLVLAASVRGAAHEAAGEACQDALAWSRLGPGGAVVALADGAGSARRAGEGARAAVLGAVAAVCAAWAAARRPRLHTLAAAGARGARAALEQAAAARRERLRELACTLLVAVWSEHSAAIAHVGDGAAVGACAGGWTMLSAPAAGEYANETRFLSDADWRRAVRIAPARRGLTGIVAFTDGCQRAALAPGPSPFSGFLDPIARFAGRAPHPADGERQLVRLLDSPKLRDISDDDRTIAIVWRRARGG